MSTEFIQLLILLVAVLLSVLVGWLIAKIRYSNQGVSPAQINEQYIRKEVHLQLQEQADMLQEDLREKEKELRMTEKTLAANEQSLLYLKEKIDGQQGDFEKLQQQSQQTFENIANRLLEEKSEKFVKQNKQSLDETLLPLRTRILEFEQGINQRFTDEAKDKSALKEQIKQLSDLNLQLSSDAKNLATALKGDSKTQGDWGEIQLEILLERAGLQNGVHFETQNSYKDTLGKEKRPDFIINLPDTKHLIIDSKVSLKAYEKYYSSDNDKDQKLYLKAHIESLRNHIKDLSSKNYQLLYQINSPDYLLLFVPIEPAFTAALKEDNSLFTYALERNIVIVTTSTLLATMRTVSYIWKQERQKKHVLEIARQSGLLYDRFVAFVEDLKMIGQRLDGAQSSWHDAMNKLKHGKRYGNTLIGRAERIKALGAKTSRSLPEEMLEEEE